MLPIGIDISKASFDVAFLDDIYIKKALIIMNTLEFYQQTYTYDIGNNTKNCF
jgi:hypothetical protein